VLDLVTTIVVLAAALALLTAVWHGYFSPVAVVRPAIRSTGPLPPAPIPIGPAVVGNVAAPLVLVEYSDFECPFCGVFARNTWPTFKKKYVESGQVLFAFHQFPLEQIHKHAFRAAEAAVCAEDQGRFWQMHDSLFADQAHMADADIIARAATVGLVAKDFSECLDRRSEAVVRAETADAHNLSISGTPTFFLGHRLADGTVNVTVRLDGAQPEERLEAAVNKAIQSGGPGR
jgi:protein-disulfide isomerase